MKLMMKNLLKSSDRQVRAARAKGTNVPLLLDPKLILDYIDVWHKDPNTPMPYFKLTPGQSHMLAHFIQEEALGLCAGFFAMDFFGLTEASAAAVVGW